MKLKNSIKKASAVFLAFAMTISPCLSGMGTVHAAEENKPKYHVTIMEAENGTLQFKGTEAKERDYQAGETVKISVLPEKGYQLGTLTIQAVGSEEKVEDSTGGKTYTFTMPKADLTISGLFVQKDTKVKGEMLGDDEVYNIKEDTDYSKIARKPYEEIDWSVYGGNGIYEEDTKKVLESFGIEVGKDENYGSKLDELLQNRPVTLAAIDPTWDVGTVLTGNCQIQSSVQIGSQSYFTLGNFTGELAGAEMVGSGWCADHTAAEPPAGHPVLYATAIITRIDRETGYVYATLLVTPQGVTDGHTSNGNGLVGYQRVSANIRLRREFNGKAHLTKSSANTVCTTGNICYSLEGAEYGVYSDGNCQNKVATLTTDKNGSSNIIELAVGNYWVKETKAPLGYLMDARIYPITVASNQTAEVQVSDVPMNDPAAIEIKKVDKDTGKISQGTASLAGAEFTIKHYGGHYTYDEIKAGKPVQDGVNVRTWVVDTKEKNYPDGTIHYLCSLRSEYLVSGSDDFYTDLGNPILPLGTITIQETKAPNGYQLEGAELKAEGGNGQFVDGMYVAQIKSNQDGAFLDGGNIFTVSDEIVKGGVKIQKRDAHTQDSKPSGSGNFDKTEFDIISENEHEVIVEGKTYQKGEVVKHLVTNEKGYAETEKNLLPYGTYTIKEVKAPNGYIIEGITERTFEIRENGKLVDLTDKDHAIFDKLIRGDLELVKANEETQERMANIPFRLTSKTTGESHTFKTDENGYYSSASTFNKHSHDTNGGNADSGLWFGLTSNGESIPVDDSVGALPYDTYILEELKCKENEDKALYKGEIHITRAGYTVNIGTINNPDLTLRTKALDEETQTHTACVSDEVTIVDTLMYTGLKKGKTYLATATLMDKETGKAILDKDGKPITAERTFKPVTAEGEAEVEITFDATGMEGKQVVVFETVTLEGKVIVEHKDLDDASQTVRFPELKTKALDKENSTNITNADKEIVIVDMVTYKNLQPGKKYTVKGILMDKETGEPVLDAKGNKITAETKFKAKESDGTVKVTFKFDGSNLGGQTVVVFEDLYRGGKLYASHADINDEEQTVYIPKVTTAVIDTESETQNVMADNRVILKDVVTYKNLKPGKKYTVKGVLIDKQTGKPVVATKIDTQEPVLKVPEGAEHIYIDTGAYVNVENGTEGIPAGLYKRAENGYVNVGTGNVVEEIPSEIIKWSHEFQEETEGYLLDGKFTLRPEINPQTPQKEEEITSETTFVADKKDGEIEVEFAFNGRKFKGHTFVVFEEIHMDGKVVAEHKDMEDKHQTVYFPEIGTTALDKETGTHNSLADKEVTIVDTVSYKNLIPEKEYKVTGKLYDKETGKPLQVNGKEIVSETVFTPEKAEGTVEVVFKFDGTALQGKTIVAFESVTVDGKEIAVHSDIKDKDQSIYFPKLSTTATDKDDNNKTVFADKKVTILDVVAYKNLTPGETYKIVGTLMDKTTGKAVLVNGKPVQSVKKFKVEKADGTVSVEFTFDGSRLAGKDVVVFEKLYNEKDREVGNHEDINDVGQTVKMVAPPKPPVKTGDNPVMYLLFGAGVIMVGAGIVLLFKKKRK